VTLVSTPPPSYSFPSGQTAVAFAVATLFFLLKSRPRERWLAGGFALLVAWDRMYTGHHYPSDVLGGAAVGTAVSYVTARVLQNRRPFPGTPPKPDDIKLP
jgi:undecaprenyl-diphosphatase